LKRRRIYRILALILCENGWFRSVDLLYWIAVLFLGVEGNSVTEGGGLGVVDEKHRYI
jgi:hypothetical protein